ncbi:holo-ACP synthase [Nevskia sp.]|uniref:holo-ACP synthase n=1 Tax=Nevskia sp. TaxID=1929292 RepID=UPI0025D92D1F|nr:holo-ACP synthase [Nevskia sp.]
MIYGIGTDLLRIDRCEELYARQGQRAIDKLLMPEERARLPEAKSIGYGIARAFAAKEAFVKALGTGFHGVSYQDVGAVREPRARPRLIFSAAMQTRLETLGIGAAHLSFTDEAGMIFAFVVLETGGAEAVSRKMRG